MSCRPSFSKKELFLKRWFIQFTNIFLTTLQFSISNSNRINDLYQKRNNWTYCYSTNSLVNLCVLNTDIWWDHSYHQTKLANNMLHNGSRMILLRLVEIKDALSFGWNRTWETEQTLLSSQKAQKPSNRLKKSIRLYFREKKEKKLFQRDRLIDSTT